MAIRNDITVDFLASPRIVTVASPSTSLLIQDLLDTLRDIEDNTPNMGYPSLVSATGKNFITVGLNEAITLKLLNAKLAFEARPGPTLAECTVSGGSLLAEDDMQASIWPIEGTNFTSVSFAQAHAGTIVEAGSGTANEIMTRALGNTGINTSQALQIILGALTGLLSGANTTNILISNYEQDDLDMIDATVDVDQNRTEVTVTPPSVS